MREVLEDGWSFKRGKKQSGTDQWKAEEYFNDTLGPRGILPHSLSPRFCCFCDILHFQQTERTWRESQSAGPRLWT